MPRRQHVTFLSLIGAAAFLGIVFFSLFRSHGDGARSTDYLEPYHGVKVDNGILLGEATAPKLENATLKYFLSVLLSVIC